MKKILLAILFLWLLVPFAWGQMPMAIESENIQKAVICANCPGCGKCLRADSTGQVWKKGPMGKAGQKGWGFNSVLRGTGSGAVVLEASDVSGQRYRQESIGRKSEDLAVQGCRPRRLRMRDDSCQIPGAIGPGTRPSCPAGCGRGFQNRGGGIRNRN